MNQIMDDFDLRASNIPFTSCLFSSPLTEWRLAQFMRQAAMVWDSDTPPGALAASVTFGHF